MSIRETHTTVTTERSYGYRPHVHIEERVTTTSAERAAYAPIVGQRESFETSSKRTQGYQSAGSASGGDVLRIVTELGQSHTSSGISPAMGAEAAKSILVAREREKKEMHGLNERLSVYMAKVRLLEQRNQQLAGQLDALKGNWGDGTVGIKTKYQKILEGKRHLLDDKSKEKADLDIQIARLKSYIADIKANIEMKNQDTGEADRLALIAKRDSLWSANKDLSGRLELLNKEYQRLDLTQNKLKDDLDAVRKDLDAECRNRMKWQYEAQTLAEDIKLEGKVHEQEVNELLTFTKLRTPQANRNYFRQELDSAINDIRHEYDAIAVKGKEDLQTWYTLKVKETRNKIQRDSSGAALASKERERLQIVLKDIQNKAGTLEEENARLQRQLNQLEMKVQDTQRENESNIETLRSTLARKREDIAQLVRDLQVHLDGKQLLDLEIAIYRRILESEESRLNVEQIVREEIVKEERDRSASSRGMFSHRFQFRRTQEGPIAIDEIDQFGNHVTLQNTELKDQDMSGWRLQRLIDGKRKYEFTFPAGALIRAGQTAYVYGKDLTEAPGYGWALTKHDSWGVGEDILTTLYDDHGTERATHEQTIVE